MRILNILLLIFIFSSYNLYAKLYVPESYAIISSSSNRILVMLTRSPGEDESFVLPNGKKIDLRETFHSSGVFDFITNKPIWKFNWYSGEYEIQTSEDFSSIIRFNQFALVAPKKWGLIFIYNGKVIKTYSLDALLTNFKSKYFFPFETGGYYYRWEDDFVLKGNALKFKTTKRRINFFSYIIPLGYQELYSFDAKTGKILEKHINNPLLEIIIILLEILFILILVIFFIKRYRSQQKKSTDTVPSPQL